MKQNKHERAMPPPVEIRNAYYIKLGQRGRWEKECLENGIIKFGYDETPHDLCEQRNWDAVLNFWLRMRTSEGTAKRDLIQIRAFYEADEEDVFITFYDSKLFWCRPTGSATVLSEGPRYRRTVDGWRSTSMAGISLTSDCLSGALLKTQMFRGTICTVSMREYLIRKLNDRDSPEVATAKQAEQALVIANEALIKQLTWQDFELLVELIFSSSGWRRLSATGKTQKHIDIDLLLPTTGERAFVQVKGQTNTADFLEYWKTHREGTTYKAMFFVWHSGEVRPTIDHEAHLIGPSKLAQMIVDAGLSSWLRQKVS